MRLFCLLALAAISCAGPSKGSRSDHPTGSAADGAREGGEEDGDGPETIAEGAPLTEEECERFFDHVIDIEVERMRKALAEAGRPETEMPAPEQIHAIRQKMKEEEMEACLAQQRADWRCGMAAATRGEVEACASAE